MVGTADSVLIREVALFRVSFIERLHCTFSSLFQLIQVYHPLNVGHGTGHQCQ